MNFSEPSTDAGLQPLPGSRSPLDPARLVPRGRHNVPREFVVATQRERLLDALALVVAEKGYSATTVTDIVIAAGISTRTFYEHFADKEECFLAAYDFGIEILYSRVRAAYEAPARWPQKIRAGIEVLLGLLAAEPAFARLCVVEINATGARGIERRQTVLASFAPFFDVPGHAKGGPPLNRPAIVQGVVGGIYECIYAAVVEGGTAGLPDLAGPLVYLAVLPFIGPARSRVLAMKAHSVAAPPRVGLEEVRAKP